MQENSKIEVKKYFLPVYAVWAIIIPVVLILLNAYQDQTEGASIFEFINWSRIPAMFALYGLVYPLTIVTFEAFLISFTDRVGFDGLGDAFAHLGDPDDPSLAAKAKKSVILSIWLIIIWGGPVVHLIIAFILHKRFVDGKYGKIQKWSDYLYGFI